MGRNTLKGSYRGPCFYDEVVSFTSGNDPYRPGVDVLLRNGDRFNLRMDISIFIDEYQANLLNKS